MVLAVGEHYVTPLPSVLLRVADAFGGGVGGCREELCGLVSGAAIVMGALWGRAVVGENDDVVRSLACAYRERFIGMYGATECHTVRDAQPEGDKRCALVVEQGTRALVEMIEEGLSAHPLADRSAR